LGGALQGFLGVAQCALDVADFLVEQSKIAVGDVIIGANLQCFQIGLNGTLYVAQTALLLNTLIGPFKVALFECQ